MGALGRLAASVKGSVARDRRRAKSSRPSRTGEGGGTQPDAATGRGGASGHPGPGPADALGSGGIDVVYAPELDGDPDPGEVVWAWVPFEEDPSQGKDRPVLVVGHDGPLLAAVQLSSRDHSQREDRGEWVEVGRGGWDREGRVSYVDAERLLRLEPSAVRREGAILDRPRFDAVIARVTALHHWRP